MSTVFKQRTAVVTIYPDDYLDQIRHLEAKFEAALASEKGAGPRTNDEVPESHRIAQEHDDLVREAEAQAVHVKVGALPRKTWKKLVSEHPPRKADVDGATEQQARSDMLSGVNDETFKEVLVPLSILEPAITEEDLDALADIDYDRLYLAAFGLNRGRVEDPKASLVSRLTQTSDETSS
jgi:hypothetical protein